MKKLKGANPNEAAFLSIGIASPETILKNSNGQVTTSKLLSSKKRVVKINSEGLESERIFGPTKDYRCSCGTFQGVAHAGKVCPNCNVLVTRSSVRHERMGHITLAYPVANPLFYNSIMTILRLQKKEIDSLYNMETFLQYNNETDSYEVKDISQMPQDFIDVTDIKIGSNALYTLLSEISHLRYDKEVFEGGLNAEHKDTCKTCRHCYERYNDGYEHIFQTSKPSTVDEKMWNDFQKLIRHELKDEFVIYEDIEGITQYCYEKIKGKLTKEMTENLSEVLVRSVIEREIQRKQRDESLQCNTCKLLHETLEESEQSSLRTNIRYIHDKLLEEWKTSNKAMQLKLKKQIALVNEFLSSKQEARWMIITQLPVPPANTRPSVLLGDGNQSKIGVHDTTTLLQKVQDYSMKFQTMKSSANLALFLNSYKLMQHGIECLFNNSDSSGFKNPMRNRGTKLLTSYSKLLSGKYGLLRSNLLGKRVDYSGRSVITVDPTLHIDEVGLPKEILLELFHPFMVTPLQDKIQEEENLHLSVKSVSEIIKTIKNRNYNYKNVERYERMVFDVLAEQIQGKRVLINRAPTLHKLSVQSFKIKITEGRAIKMPPLVCAGFNADFDGDQVAVHLPLSIEAQTESAELLDAKKNLLKPADGQPVCVPSQDMILGVYYLTLEKDGEKGEGKSFRDEAEVELAYAEGVISFHSKIKLRREIAGEYGIIETTYGKILVNRIIPQDLGFVDRKEESNKYKFEVDFKLDKGNLKKLVSKCYEVHGNDITAEMLDSLKSMGYHYSTKAGFTIAVSDATIPEEKAQLLKEAEEKVAELNEWYNEGYISEGEKTAKVISLWSKVTEDVADVLKDTFMKTPYNPVWMMADSGARGSMSQIRQLAGMRGLIANASGKTVEVPIKSNYREGLTGLEYFTSGKGARKGFVDTALRTADAGYLTRRLVELGQSVIITEQDCEDTEGYTVTDIYAGQELIESLSERLEGRYLLSEEEIEVNGEKVTIKTDHYLSKEEAKLLSEYRTEVKIRSVLTCKCVQGVCTKCYGKNLSYNRPSEIGEAVGVIAAQSIGEPGTQLTMRTFHTGGAASEDDITQGLPRIEALFEARRTTSKSQYAILAECSGTVHYCNVENRAGQIIPSVKIIKEDGTEKVISVHNYKKMLIKDGAKVEQGMALTSGPIVLSELFDLKGTYETHKYFIKEVQTTYRQQGVDIQDKHIEVLLLNMLGYCIIQTSATPFFKVDEEVSVNAVESFNSQFPLPLVTYKRLFRGASVTALLSSNWLTAAGFQKTFSTLRDSAIKHKVDKVDDLMSSVAIGKLIPVGTGVVDTLLQEGKETDEITTWTDLT